MATIVKKIKITIIIIILIFNCMPAYGWGEVAHHIIAESAAQLIAKESFVNCHFSKETLITHVNDPDKIWRNQRHKYPQENVAHFFHLDQQPSDWKKKRSTTEPKKGLLVYRILSWFEEAKKSRSHQQWDNLNEKLIGLSHYLGDLTQPLHLHHDHDGKEAHLPGLHSQFETKMINKFKNELAGGVNQQLKTEKIPVYWQKTNYDDLIFTIASQSNAKASQLFSNSIRALSVQHSYRSNNQKIRFSKPALWQANRTLAIEQVTLAARLLAHSVDLICRY